MNKRQRAKKRHAEPVQEAWNVVAAHVISVSKIPCLFVNEEGYSVTDKRLQLYNLDGFKIVSQPLREGNKK